MKNHGWILVAATLALAGACQEEGDDGESGAGGGAGGDDAGTEPAGDAGEDAGEPEPKPEFIPVATGPCPGFVDGDGCEVSEVAMTCKFHPEGTLEREVRFWFDDSAWEVDSRLVFFFHGWFRQALDAALPLAGWGPDVIDAIVTEGGIVASPEMGPDRGEGSFGDPESWPWYSTGKMDDPDLLLMDEVVACAHETLGVDFRRIHSSGMSAGGLQVGQAAESRSGYLASVAVFSGGQIGAPEVQDPENHFAAILFHGGESDKVIINFDEAQESLKDLWDGKGHFTVICNHESGHFIPTPPAYEVDAPALAWQFLQDHPYGVDPRPYADGLPEIYQEWCSL
jgi:dienelactone hydrolase